MLAFISASILLAINVAFVLSSPLEATQYKRDECEKYKFDITWKTRAPDGFARQMILVNDKFPGPPIHIKEGDCVEVRDSA
jgi:hypothetical protein